MHKTAFTCMNTTIRTFDLPEESSRKTLYLFKKAESTLSRFDESSELSQLNKTIRIPFVCSSILFEAIRIADFYYTGTKGIFNPYLGGTLIDLGYDRSFEEIEACPDSDEQLPSYKPDSRPLTIDAGMKSVTLKQSIQIDLGGIAKGWTAQCIAELLQDEGIRTGAISAGGDICVWGLEHRQHFVKIDHPLRPGETIASIALQRDAGIATSSIVKRHWNTISGKRRHHIIDPRTGMPSNSNLIQTSVIAPTLTEAEALAKCLLILGWEEGLKKFEGNKNIAFIGVTTDEHCLQGGNINLYSKEGVKQYV